MPATETASAAPAGISIRGDGVAALCCARLLHGAGFAVRPDRTPRPRVPAIMLSEPALALIRDVFGLPALFAELPRIDRRIVAWGEGAEPVTLPHSGVVVSETLLLESLGAPACDPGASENFMVFTSRPLPDGVTQHSFGFRRASAVPVILRDAADASAVFIESGPGGWLFLIPNQTESAWLLAVGAGAEAQLAESRLIAPRIAGPASHADSSSAEFPTCPRTIWPLGGESWLACGSAAMGFDPICGDGTATAVREAILASAVIRAIAGGEDRGLLLAHYQRRLLAGMQKHLALCADYYRTGGSGTWWQGELEALRLGFEWCSRTAARLAPANYRLNGDRLEGLA